MPLDVTQEEMTAYRATARRRRQQEQDQLRRRRERAWQAAKRAAALLKEQFGVTRVAVFGSLIRQDCFTRWSDVDIAAWGIAPVDTFRAMSAIEELDGEIELNLVDVAACRPSLRTAIERDGGNL